MKRRSVLTYISARLSILATDPCLIWSVCPISSCESFKARRTSARSISSPRRCASACALTCASGDMRARSSAKLCLPAIVLLLLQLGQMLVIKGIGDRDHLFIKPPVAGLVAADQQDCHAARIEGIEDAQRLGPALHAQLSHMSMARSVDAARIGKRQVGTALLQPADMGVDSDLLGLGKGVPPVAEFVRILTGHSIRRILFLPMYKFKSSDGLSHQPQSRPGIQHLQRSVSFSSIRRLRR